MHFHWFWEQNQRFPLISLSELTSHSRHAYRGAGAPEALGRGTAEEEFRLRRNQPLNMAPSAPKDRYYQSENFAQLFQKRRLFWGPGKRFVNR